MNQEKSRLTTAEEGFAFLGFEFRKPPGRLLYMWPRKKACQHIRDRVCEKSVRSFPSSASDQGGDSEAASDPEWVVYLFSEFSNSNRIFHQIDWAVLERAATMAPTQTPTQLAFLAEALELSVPV